MSAQYTDILRGRPPRTTQSYNNAKRQNCRPIRVCGACSNFIFP